ncbi:MAG: cation diffusion facilitator family transporter [Firmicutes bacterium]|jgi:cation diffusion facilitator family transporter|nr:cation diffusion facilitator family transporter [Bacillota bacterium]
MRSITALLLDLFIKNGDRTSDPADRTAYGCLEAWVSIAGNIVIAVLNFFLGVTLNSIALTAQSIHTASDVVTSGVVLLGFRAASRPPDERHPYGHGRIETVAALAIAVLLVVVGFEFLGKSLDRIVHGANVRGNLVVVGILIAVGLVKEWMARFSSYLGKVIDSPALEADAWHHRSDAIAAVLVSVSIASASAGYPAVDAVLGLVVSALIVYTGAKLAWSSTSVLVGEGADPRLIALITRAAESVHGVRSIHGLNVHDYGGVKIASVHIQVDPELSVRDSHRIAGAVKYAVRNAISIECVVHVEPDAPGE